MMTTTPRFKHYSNSITYKIEAKEHDYLYIETSQIPGSGNGLFTAIPIYQDEVISVFKGEVLSAREARSRALNNEDGCFVNLPDGTLLDSMQVNCFAKYANDANGFVRTVHKNNATITLDEDGAVCIVASRNIAAGKEIFCSYGKKYWQNTIEKGKNIEQAVRASNSPDCHQSFGA
jgi:SET domain-containing protein